MSRLEELIQEYCPDGVEYRALKAIAKMQRGQSLTKANSNRGDIPVISGGKEPAFFCDKYNREGEIITIAGSGAGAGYVQYFNRPIYANDCFTVQGNKELNTKYLFYCLAKKQGYIYGTKKGGGIPHVHISDIENMNIPVPPLPVQEEIVRILDNFTQLTAELQEKLQAELQARKKQYEHHKNELLSFNDEAIMQSLGEVCDVIAGGTPSKKKSDYWNDGTVKWLGSTVCQNHKTVDSVTDYITEKGLASSSAKMMKKNTTLIALVGATIGKVAYLPFDAAINQNIAGVYPRDTNILDPSYVYYACTTLYPKFVALTQGTKLAMANISFVRSLQIPVPPIDIQKRIVYVLDRFDALCNDLSTGLPAEIQARQKQYEYYRDKLLTFPPLS